MVDDDNSVSKNATFSVEGESQLWRRWIDGSADFVTGNDVQESKLAVVVIGHRGQPGLPGAVKSLIDQEMRPEIVVVNSNGGDARTLLKPYLERITLIDVEQRLFAGGARNIGIDATRAPHIAFLAGDSVVLPDWVRGRVIRHEAGATAVSCAIVPSSLRSPVSLAAYLFLHHSRMPSETLDQPSLYGLSYNRNLFVRHGYFSPGLRIGEDTDFNLRFREEAVPVWAPEVRTVHHDPTSPKALIASMESRGKRAGRYHAYLLGAPPRLQKNWFKLLKLVFWRYRIAAASISEIEGMTWGRAVLIHLCLILAAAGWGVGMAQSLGSVIDAKRAFAQSRAAVKLRDAETARRQAQAAIEAEPQNADYRRHLATILFRMRDDGPLLDEAKGQARAAADLSLGDIRNLVSLAKILEAQDDLQGVRRVADQAVYCCPTEPDVHIYLAQILAASGDVEAARGAALYARTINPHSPKLAGILRKLAKPD